MEHIVKCKINSISRLKDKAHVTSVFQPIDPEGTEAWMNARNELVSHLQSTLTSHLRKIDEAEKQAEKKSTAGVTKEVTQEVTPDPDFLIAP